MGTAFIIMNKLTAGSARDNIPRSTFLKLSLIVATLLLCICVPVVNTEVSTSNWTSPTTEECLNSVHMLNANDGWAVGTGAIILHWDGRDWSLVPSPYDVATLNSVFMVSSNDVWAVGTRGRIIHWDGNDWSLVPSPYSGVNLHSVFMLSSDDGWAVGSGGTALHWDGSEWKAVYTGSYRTTYYSVYMVSANEGWAVGDWLIRWNGEDWIQSPSLPYVWADHMSVYMVSSSDVWVANYDGKILHWNGTHWYVWKEFWNIRFVSLHMVSASEGWAVNQFGDKFAYWNGIDWNLIDISIDKYFQSVCMVSSDDGWVVGEKGTILRWDGIGWRSSSSQSPAPAETESPAPAETESPAPTTSPSPKESPSQTFDIEPLPMLFIVVGVVTAVLVVVALNLYFWKRGK